MPLSGNRSGPKSVYGYTSDAGVQINLLLDDDLVIVNSGLVLSDEGQPKPQRFKPRVVFAQAIVNGAIIRKQLVCGSPTAPFYASNQPVDVVIDGLTFTTTGRRGETQSFLSNAAQPLVP